ncbi:F-box protein [Raphanus sativus]|nr:F-box protein [Raphanus sativus]
MDRSSSSSSSDQDWISKLPNDVLLMILSGLCTKEAIRTSVLSKRWEHVWKHVSHLEFDKPKILSSTELCDDEPNPDDTLITKIIIKHLGQLESCVLNYSSSQGRTGILGIWIQIFTSVKHTRVLTLNRHYDDCGKLFEFPADSFSHPSLASLSLSTYTFTSSHPFRNCSNLRTLKLVSIDATNVEVFNTLLLSCPSLEVLVLKIRCFYNTGVDPFYPGSPGPLKIENNKLKLVHVLLKRNIGGLEVSSASLEILVVEETCFGKEGFFLSSPKLQFTKNFWVPGRRFAPHISYNISEDNNKNGPNESWEKEKKLWEEDNDNNNVVAFPDAKFRVKALWMPNFSGSEEEFAFASCLIKHGTVVDKVMIKTSVFTASKKLEVEAAVDKLRALQTEEDQLKIKCY